MAGGLNVVAPSANLAPPGPYMLFILNGNGVPSVARIVTLTSSSGTSPTLSSLSPSSAAVGGPAFTLTVNGSNFVSGSVVQMERRGAADDLRERHAAHGGDSGQRHRERRRSASHGDEPGRCRVQRP